jgi:hypothetical protein
MSDQLCLLPEEGCRYRPLPAQETFVAWPLQRLHSYCRIRPSDILLVSADSCQQEARITWITSIHDWLNTLPTLVTTPICAANVKCYLL